MKGGKEEKETVLTYSNILFQHKQRGIDEKHKKPVRIQLQYLHITDTDASILEKVPISKSDMPILSA